MGGYSDTYCNMGEPYDRLSKTGQSQRTIYDSTNMRLLDTQTGRGEERAQDGRCKVLEINGSNSTQL